MVRYTVGNRGAVATLLFFRGGSAVLFVGLVGVVWDRWWLALIGAVLTVLYSIHPLVQVRHRLDVGPSGITLQLPGRPGMGRPRRGAMAWQHVAQVVVQPELEVVRVVLKPEAPLPSWVRGRVWDPEAPEVGVDYERDVPGLDPVALDHAVRANAPYVEVRTQHGSF